MRIPDVPYAVSLSESGFSLIGILVAIIIALLITCATFYYLDLSGTRGKAIYQTMQSVIHASQNFAANTGCYPGDMSALGTPGAGGHAMGLDDCVPNNHQWDGPYLTQTIYTTNGDLPIPGSQSGAQGTVAAIETGNWLSNNAEMAGRGSLEVAVVIGPLSADTQGKVCKLCNGCAGQGQNTPSTCFVQGKSVGEVFASVG